ncbi:MAG: DUF3067 family protein [Cyanobium sp. 49614_E6]|nr:DUF3067 family protein [Cyanobium sp. 49614_E6]
MRPPPVTLADSSGAAADPGAPLSGAEVRALLVARWQANHDLRLVQIRGRLYLQVMWNHLEQQSFPLSVEDYADHIERVAAARPAWARPFPCPSNRCPVVPANSCCSPGRNPRVGGRRTTLAHR